MQADVERLLARLLTDRDLRERFIADPTGIAIAEGLTAEEAEMTARMPVQDLRAAGRSYEHKRKAKGGVARKTWFARWPWARRP
jgi:hypothetical protein